MSVKQTCPRRMSGLGPWEREEGLDRWHSQGGLIGQEKIGLGCSFCGSLHPDRFMELVREGWIVGPTDKSYKAYLSRSLTDEEKAARKAAWLAERGGIAETIRFTGAKDGKTPAQIAADVEKLWARHWAMIGESGGGQEAKFYFQHLSDDQKREFVDLYNARTMRVGYPGFYRMPFFMTHAPAGPEDSS